MRASPETAKWLETMHRALGPVLTSLLHDERVTDLCINPDGRVFVERVGESMEDTGITQASASTLGLIRAVAAIVRAEVHAEHPILETRMPGFGLRFEGLIPPIVEAPTVALRKPASITYPLESYVETGRMSAAAYEVVMEAIRARRNILIAGSTGSGKTTFGMAVLRAVGEHTPEDRVFLIEDTPELDDTVRRHVPNAVSTRACAVASMDRLLFAALRMIPTRIVVGEVRGAEALVLLKAWNTGHGGGLCTIHANSARDALHRLASLAAEGTNGYVPRDEVRRCVELVVFLARRRGHRGVDQIVRVRGLDERNEYVCEEIYDARDP